MRSSRFGDPNVLLALLGGVTAGVYALLVWLYPLVVHAAAARPYDLEQLSRGRAWAAYLYVGGLVLAFVCFALAFPLVRRARRPLPWIVGFGLLFGAILIWLYPVTATDVFAYIFRARQNVIHGQNPLALPPDGVPGDPLLIFLGEWSKAPSPYGPGWEALAGIPVQLGFAGQVDGALAFKMLAFAAYALGLWVVAWGTKYRAEAVLLFAWNPLVLLEGPGNGHNDLLMIVLAALAVAVWWRRRWWALAVVLLTLAATVKAPAVLVGPLLLAEVLRSQQGWLRRGWVLVASIVLGAGVILLTFIPFWPPWESVAGLIGAFANQRTYTITATVRLTLAKLGAGPVAETAPRQIGQLILVMGYIWLVWRTWRGRFGVAEAGFWAFFLYLLTAASYRIWYPLWLVPLAALSVVEIGQPLTWVRMRWRTYLMSLMSELSILMFYLVWRWLLNGTVLPKADWFLMHVLTIPWQFGVPLLVPLLIRRAPEPD
jgi:hypothetical protein